jgi:hypothetical protein
MTQNICEIERWEMEDDDEMEEMIALQAAHVKERLAEYTRYCEMADEGQLCEACKWRRMDEEGGIGYGSGLCEKCADEALSIYQDAVRY